MFLDPKKMFLNKTTYQNTVGNKINTFEKPPQCQTGASNTTLGEATLAYQVAENSLRIKRNLWRLVDD
jgi:hypothetical protein